MCERNSRVVGSTMANSSSIPRVNVWRASLIVSALATASGISVYLVHRYLINDPKFDELVTKARQTFDPAARDAALAELHAASVDDAAFLYVAHDVAPRAMSPKIRSFVQAKSWFVDFSPVTMAQ